MTQPNSKDIAAKVANNLVIGTYLNTTNKFVKQVQMPLNLFEPVLHNKPPERYGASKRAIKFGGKSQASNSNSLNNSQVNRTETASQKSDNPFEQIMTPINKLKNQGLKHEQKSSQKQSKTPVSGRSNHIIRKRNDESHQSPATTTQTNQIFVQPSKNTLDFAQTPQPARYGNRRAQAQKADQIIQKYQNEIKQASETPQVTKFQPKITQRKANEITNLTIKYNNIRDNNSEASSSHVSPNRRFATEYNDSVQQSQKAFSQIQPKQTIFTRSRVQPALSQVDSKQSLNKSNVTQKIQIGRQKNIEPVKAQAKKLLNRLVDNSKKGQEDKQPVKKKSNTVIWLLNKLYKRKTKNVWDRLNEIQRTIKNKENRFSKLLLYRISCLFKQKSTENCYISFQKLASTLEVKSQPVSKDLNRIKKDRKKICFFALHNIFKTKISTAFSNLKFYKVPNKNWSLIPKIVDTLLKRKMLQVFTKIKDNLDQEQNRKVRVFTNLCWISKRFVKNLLGLSMRKIYAENRESKQDAEGQNKKNPTSPIYQFNFQQGQNQQKSPLGQKDQSRIKNSIRKLENTITENEKKLALLKEQIKSQSSPYQKRIQQLKFMCSDQSQQNQQKKKISEELKQRIQEIKVPEEDYIEPHDILTETKLPILYEVYMRIKKIEGQTVSVDDLINISPSFSEDLIKNKNVNDWIELKKNLELKESLKMYEGEIQYERRALKIINQEYQMLNQMVRGYLKEKYTWEWVKNALSQASGQI